MAVQLLGAAANLGAGAYRTVSALIRSQGFKKAVEKYGEEVVEFVQEVTDSISQPGAPLAGAESAGSRKEERKPKLSPEDIERERKKVKQQRLDDEWLKRKNQTDDAVAQMIAERKSKTSRNPKYRDRLPPPKGYKSGGTVARNRRNHKGSGCVMSDRRKKTLYT